MAETYYTRLILEIVLWGGLAFLLEIGSNIAGISLSADPEFPNGVGNKTGSYLVE